MKSELPADQPPIVINGREYPLWSQFVHRKAEWIGGVMEDYDMGRIARTGITDIKLEPNGDKYAWFEVSGKDFNCGFCTSIGGISSGESGWITFSGYGGHTWRIKNPTGVALEPELPLS